MGSAHADACMLCYLLISLMCIIHRAKQHVHHSCWQCSPYSRMPIDVAMCMYSSVIESYILCTVAVFPVTSHTRCRWR